MSHGQRTGSHCTLIIPGLLGPAVPVEELPRDDWPTRADLPCLSRLLRRAKRAAHPYQSFEYQILRQLGLAAEPGVELPVAYLRKRVAAEKTTTHRWCLDPVHLQLDKEKAYLDQPDALTLTESEAQQLIASLNTHFGDELTIEYYSPHEWLVELSIELSTTPPTQAVAKDLRQVQAGGKEARRWRTLLNEIQMLMHTHPVNLAREENGIPTINSLWLWGGGELAVSSTAIDCVYTNDRLSTLAASCAAIQHQTLPATISADILTDQNSLIVLTFLLDAIRRKDVFAWLNGLHTLEQHYLKPLETMLRQGLLSEFTLMSETLDLTENKPGLVKWWQRSKSLSSVMTELRDGYGY